MISGYCWKIVHYEDRRQLFIYEQRSYRKRRSFDKSRVADKKVFLINEAAKKYFGWKDIKGKETGYYTFVDKPDGSYTEIPQRGAVIGVIGDYNHTDLKKSIQPLIISLSEGWESEMAIKLNPGNFPLVGLCADRGHRGCHCRADGRGADREGRDSQSG
jgi:hypothetical protein